MAKDFAEIDGNFENLYANKNVPCIVPFNSWAYIWMMPKALLFFLFQVFFLSGFSQNIVNEIDKEIKSIKINQLYAQPDTGYRHNPKGERIGIILDTAYFDSKKNLVLFTRNMRMKGRDSVERGTKQYFFFLKNNKCKAVEEYTFLKGLTIHKLYFNGNKLIKSNFELSRLDTLYWTAMMQELKSNVQFGKKYNDTY
jgi:hypothetical protein